MSNFIAHLMLCLVIFLFGMLAWTGFSNLQHFADTPEIWAKADAEVVSWKDISTVSTSGKIRMSFGQYQTVSNHPDFLIRYWPKNSPPIEAHTFETPPQRKFQVTYNPENPKDFYVSDSGLRPDLYYDWIYAIGGSLFTFSFVFLWIFQPRKKTNRNPVLPV